MFFFPNCRGFTACCDSETWRGWEIISCMFSNYAVQTVAHSEKSCAPTHFLVSMFLRRIFMGTDIFFGIGYSSCNVFSECIFFCSGNNFSFSCPLRGSSALLFLWKTQDLHMNPWIICRAQELSVKRSHTHTHTCWGAWMSAYVLGNG